MKNSTTVMNVAKLVLGLAGALIAVSAQAQTEMTCPNGLPAGTTCYNGKDENGAFYFIAKPADWNNMLVVHAHGGPSNFGPEKLDSAIRPAVNFQVVVSEGYAWASTSYRRGGYGVRMGAEDVDNARKVFIAAFGKPRRTIVHGQSYGGSVAAKLVEIYAANYDGAMFTSGVVAGATRFYPGRADMRAVYQYYCNNHPRPDEPQYPLWSGLPLDSNMTVKDLEERLNECTGIRLPAAQRSDQQKQNLANILNVTRTPERTFIINMDRATFLFQDIVHRRLGGRNPFSNEGVQYTGSTDDAGLNRGAARFKADPKAVADFAYDADPTGKVTIPTVTVHAIDDPQVPVEVDAMYREIRDQAGSGDKLVQTFTDEHVHPKLSTPQYAALLAGLREWMEADHKPTPQSISDSCGKFADIYAEPGLFLPEYQPRSFWSRAYPRTQ
jgi:pimeloyl-ACP methyl ester carboxylesterase